MATIAPSGVMQRLPAMPEGYDEAAARRHREWEEATPADLRDKLAKQYAEMEEADNWAHVQTLADIDRSPAPDLLIGFLDPVAHTMAYGTGGVGKGLLAAS
jgi:hypothetical protein